MKIEGVRNRNIKNGCLEVYNIISCAKLTQNALLRLYPDSVRSP